MKIMVFDVPAEFGGALTILKQYYKRAVEDKENEWIFVIGKPELCEKENVRIIRLPWTKKSWLHRLWFDNFYAKKLIKKHNPDKVISLQNTTVKAKGYFQELYVHQALIFSEKRFSLKENKKFWIYQNIISKMIFKSIKKADCVIVQTKWMKDSIINTLGKEEEKIKVIAPDAEFSEGISYKKAPEINFFYPSGKGIHKNHSAIYRAVEILKEKGYTNFNLYLTLEKPEKEQSENIKFLGYIPKDEVNNYYQKSALLFASYIESFGLPLLEARTYGCPIIASDCSFSREILEEYENAQFFDPFSPKDLAEKMIEYIEAY